MMTSDFAIFFFVNETVCWGPAAYYTGLPQSGQTNSNIGAGRLWLSPRMRSRIVLGECTSMKVVIDWHQPTAGFNGPAAVWRNPTKPDGFGKGVRVEKRGHLAAFLVRCCSGDA